MEQASSLCVATLSYSFVSVDHLPAFCPLHFQCCDTSPRVPFMWGSLPPSLPLAHVYPFFPMTTPFMSMSVSSLSSSGCISSCISIPVSAVPSVTAVSVWFRFHSIVTTSHLFSLHSSLLTSSLLGWPICMQCPMDLPLGHRGAAQPHTLLSVCVLNPGCAVTRMDLGRSGLISHWYSSFIYAVICRLESQQHMDAKACTLCDNSVNAPWTLNPEPWTLSVGDWCYLTGLWYLKSVCIWTMHRKDCLCFETYYLKSNLTHFKNSNQALAG